MPNPYQIIVDYRTTIYFDFCFTFVPPECPNISPAFSYLVTDLWAIPNSDTQKRPTNRYACERYSSNSTTSLFYTKYERDDGNGKLKLMMFTSDPSLNSGMLGVRYSEFGITCSERYGFTVDDYKI
jgi:hypothetical protein